MINYVKHKLNTIIYRIIIFSILLILFVGTNSNIVRAFELEEMYGKDIVGELSELCSNKIIMGVIENCDEYEVKAEPDYDSEVVYSLPLGSSIYIEGVEVIDPEYWFDVWYKVSFYRWGVQYTGYIERDYFYIVDEDFLSWEEEFNAPFSYGFSLMAFFGEGIEPLAEEDPIDYSDVERFPVSYQEKLKELKKLHPNWHFTPIDTELDWQTVINNEIINGKSLISSAFKDYNKEGLYGQSWYYPSEVVLKYYMDPRNWIDEKHIFQFELLSFNESYHNEEALVTFLASTFMKSRDENGDIYAPGGDNRTFANIFYTVGQTQTISPYHLAARVFQEQGKADQPLISGTIPGYEGFYNYFNIGATGTSDQEVINNGINYAKNHGWSTAYLSILGGSEAIGNNYIKKGQNTLYFEKFNVSPNSMHTTYEHQYMQNIAAPENESESTYKQYIDAGSIDSNFEFVIPIFKNMPDEACQKATSSPNIVLERVSGYDYSCIYVDGVPYGNVIIRNGQAIINVGDLKTAKTAVVYKYDASGIVNGMYTYNLSYANNTYYETKFEAIKDLFKYEGFSARICDYNGIRFSTSIPTALRDELISTGIDGYKMTEYGVVVMNANRLGTADQMIKGQPYTDFGVSYADNGAVNKYSGIADGKLTFTFTLTHLPKSVYKTTYAFRAYAVIEKGGVSEIIYGPILTRGLYDMCNRLLPYYPDGTSENNFLKSIIAEADAV